MYGKWIASEASPHREGLSHLLRILTGTDPRPLNLLDPDLLAALPSRDAFFEDLGMLLARCVGSEVRTTADRRGIGLLVALLHLLCAKVDVHRDHEGLPVHWSGHPACLPMLADIMTAGMETFARASLDHRLEDSLREWLSRAIAAADVRRYHARVTAELVPLATMRPRDAIEVLLRVDSLMLPFRSDRIRALTISTARARPAAHRWVEARQAYARSATAYTPRSSFELLA
jgi:hypothetical protein